MSEPSARVFIDSNIWLYALIEVQDVAKTKTSHHLIAHHAEHVVISNQVVIEVIANLIKKAVLEEAKLRDLISGFYKDNHVVNLDANTMRYASELRERYRLSYWDSLIVAAALESDVATLFTEDMHDGLVVDGRLTIVNPFAANR